jgi:hypothetical protein
MVTLFYCMTYEHVCEAMHKWLPLIVMCVCAHSVHATMIRVPLLVRRHNDRRTLRDGVRRARSTFANDVQLANYNNVGQLECHN